MKPKRLLGNPLATLALVLISVSTFTACAANTVTFDNQSGKPALVKLVGPTSASVSVEAGKGGTTEAAAGHYFIKVRYGTPGKYVYSKGDEFDVTETATSSSKITITLHTVRDGNYGSRGISENDFDKDDTEATGGKKSDRSKEKDFPVLLTISPNLWVPMEKSGTGFFGGTGSMTPPVSVHYSKKAYTGTNAAVVTELKVNDDKGKTQILSLIFDQELFSQSGEVISHYMDPYGDKTYSGEGALRVYLKDKVTGEAISNVIIIPVAVDEDAKKRLEKKYGPSPKKK